MKKAAIGFIAIAIALAALASTGAAPSMGGPLRNKLEGTREHTFENQPELRQIKVINQDHYIWATYVKATRMPVFTAGGTYTLVGNSYKETAEFGRFGSPEWQATVGKELSLHVEINGDTMLLTDAATKGQKLRETWKRIGRSS
jgi:hypothetical protein